MRTEIESWAKRWEAKLRKEMGPGIEVKRSGNRYYIHRSTTYWDKELKKRRKKSPYLGTLDRKKGLIKSSGRVLTRFTAKTVKQYGNSRLFASLAQDLLSTLQSSFRDYWQELYALAMIRLFKKAPIKRIASCWDDYYNTLQINPHLSPEAVSRIFREVGADRESQNILFRQLMKGKDAFAYDLTVVFTRSEGITFAENNKERLRVLQINLVLLASLDDELPSAIRTIPGSVRDISTLYVTIEEFPLENVILVLDRGFFSDDLMEVLAGKDIFYVIPARSDSTLYRNSIHLRGHFFYNKRLIKCGKRGMNGFTLYLFEDVLFRAEEEKVYFERLDKKKVSAKPDKTKFGRILVVSNLDKTPEEIFLLLKQREEVEKAFDVYKNVLEADRLYLQDDESVFGHVFVSFLALYAYSKIRALLKKIQKWWGRCR